MKNEESSFSAEFLHLKNKPRLIVRQKFEIAEMLGIETRNKYQVVDQDNQPVAFVAEQKKGFLALLLRQWIGHWGKLEFYVFNSLRQKVLRVHQPFRFFWQRLEVHDANGVFLGAIQQRFSFFIKRFDIEDSQGQVLMDVSSRFFRQWAFSFRRGEEQVVSIRKKWDGILTEIFTDKDSFVIEFADGEISEAERNLVLCAALFIDLRYYEVKAS